MKKDQTTPQTVIGIDLGDKKHAVCVMNQAGKILRETTVPNTAASLKRLFGEFPAALAVREVDLRHEAGDACPEIDLLDGAGIAGEHDVFRDVAGHRPGHPYLRRRPFHEGRRTTAAADGEGHRDRHEHRKDRRSHGVLRGEAARRTAYHSIVTEVHLASGLPNEMPGLKRRQRGRRLAAQGGCPMRGQSGDRADAGVSRGIEGQSFRGRRLPRRQWLQ